MSDSQYDHMTERQLRQLQLERYRQAVEDGTFTMLAAIARELGWDPKSRDKDGNPTGYESDHGPKYKWKCADISIYVDDYGHYMTVHSGSKELCSTHETNRFIIPGEWLDEVLPYYNDAIVKQGERLNKLEARRRADALSKIK